VGCLRLNTYAIRLFGITHHKGYELQVKLLTDAIRTRHIEAQTNALLNQVVASAKAAKISMWVSIFSVVVATGTCAALWSRLFIARH